jgi:hypothetical protein
MYDVCCLLSACLMLQHNIAPCFPGFAFCTAALHEPRLSHVWFRRRQQMSRCQARMTNSKLQQQMLPRAFCPLMVNRRGFVHAALCGSFQFLLHFFRFPRPLFCKDQSFSAKPEGRHTQPPHFSSVSTFSILMMASLAKHNVLSHPCSHQSICLKLLRQRPAIERGCSSFSLCHAWWSQCGEGTTLQICPSLAVFG